MIVIDEATRAALGLDVVRGRAELDAIAAELERGLEEMGRAIGAIDKTRVRVCNRLLQIEGAKRLSDKVLERLAGAQLEEVAP